MLVCLLLLLLLTLWLLQGSLLGIIGLVIVYRMAWHGAVSADRRIVDNVRTDLRQPAVAHAKTHVHTAPFSLLPVCVCVCVYTVHVLRKDS